MGIDFAVSISLVYQASFAECRRSHSPSTVFQAKWNDAGVPINLAATHDLSFVENIVSRVFLSALWGS